MTIQGMMAMDLNGVLGAAGIFLLTYAAYALTKWAYRK